MAIFTKESTFRAGAFAYLLGFCLLAACSTLRTSDRRLGKTLRQEVIESAVFRRGLTGFHLVDAATGRELCNVQADRYFTPASNTKVLTLATCLAVLGDSLTGFAYTVPLTDTAGVLRPTGDPVFLHPRFQAWQAPYLLLAQNRVRRWWVDYSGWQEQRYGPGWSWDDYNDNYAQERSAFPVFNNMFRVEVVDSARALVRVQPGRVQPLRPSAALAPSDGVLRGEQADVFYASPQRRFRKGYIQEIPLRTAASMEASTPQIFDYLQDTLQGVRFQTLPIALRAASATLQQVASAPVDTVYRLMMQESDNFLAEQLLLQAAWRLTDTLQQSKARQYGLKKVFPPSSTPPNWVDGSGLSRYNLIAPQFLTALLRQLYQRYPKERLFAIFPAGGVSGTVKDWYAGPQGKPYVFAKTGTLSGVHCLSGYIVTAKGRVLIFSFMHNNFVGSSRPWRQEMQRLLGWIREHADG